MAFTVNEFHDLVRLLEEQPEWRAELRRLLLPDELLTLPALVRELTEAHKRAEARIAKVEKRLEKVENRLEKVENRLEKVENRLEKVENSVERLEEGQARLEAGQARLEERVGNLEQAVSSLQNVVGATAEESAEGMLYFVLPRKGYQLIGDPFELRQNGEVDVVAEAQDPEGNIVWVVVEAKVRLSHRAVMAWAQRMKSEGFREFLKNAGVPGPYLVYAYGMRIDAAAYDAAEKAGIGLLTSQDERVAPQQLIPGL